MESSTKIIMSLALTNKPLYQQFKQKQNTFDISTKCRNRPIYENPRILGLLGVLFL